MKVYCEKCHEDISIVCSRQIDSYLTGRAICPKCHQEQKRYISEADILLYFGVSEAFYVLLSFIMVSVFARYGLTYVSIAMLMALFLLSWIASRWLSIAIYQKAFFKKDLKNTVFQEDQKAIQRNISWQFMMFFAIVITYLTIDEGKVFFAIAMPLAVLMTFLKFFLQIRNEKNIK